MGNAGHRALIPALLGEVIPAVKDSSSGVRTAAYGVLLACGRALGEGGQGSWGGADEMSTGETATPPPASFSEFIKMLCGGLGSDTPKLRAATLLALSKVFHTFPTHPVLSAAIPALLPELLPLFREKSREVVTSLVSFVKACVGFLPPVSVLW